MLVWSLTLYKKSVPFSISKNGTYRLHKIFYTTSNYIQISPCIIKIAYIIKTPNPTRLSALKFTHLSNILYNTISIILMPSFVLDAFQTVTQLSY